MNEQKCVYLFTISAGASVSGEIFLFGAEPSRVVREVRVRRAAGRLRARRGRARAERRRAAAAAVRLATCIPRPTLHVEL